MIKWAAKLLINKKDKGKKESERKIEIDLQKKFWLKNHLCSRVRLSIGFSTPLFRNQGTVFFKVPVGWLITGTRGPLGVYMYIQDKCFKSFGDSYDESSIKPLLSGHPLGTSKRLLLFLKQTRDRSSITGPHHLSHSTTHLIFLHYVLTVKPTSNRRTTCITGRVKRWLQSFDRGGRLIGVNFPFFYTIIV